MKTYPNTTTKTLKWFVIRDKDGGPWVVADSWQPGCEVQGPYAHGQAVKYCETLNTRNKGSQTNGVHTQ